MHLMKTLLRNPLTIWIYWFFLTYFNEYKYASKKLSIGYLARFEQCQFGDYNVLSPDVYIQDVNIGDFSYIGARSKVLNTTIGKYTGIGPDVHIGLGKHPSSDFVSTHPIFYSPKMQSGITFSNRSYFDEFEKITIGNDVWVGARATILDGVDIADGAIIAAGAVVTQDVPPYAIVGGVPAKVLKYRFSRKQIDLLLQAKWWDRDVSWLRDNFMEFRHIDSFVELLEKES